MHSKTTKWYEILLAKQAQQYGKHWRAISVCAGVCVCGLVIRHSMLLLVYVLFLCRHCGKKTEYCLKWRKLKNAVRKFCLTKERERYRERRNKRDEKYSFCSFLLIKHPHRARTLNKNFSSDCILFCPIQNSLYRTVSVWTTNFDPKLIFQSRPKVNSKEENTSFVIIFFN